MKKNKFFLAIILTLCFLAFQPNIVKANWADCHMNVEGNPVVNAGDSFIVSVGSDGVSYQTDIYGAHFVIEYDNDTLEPVLAENGGVTSLYGWETINSEIVDVGLRVSYLIVDVETNSADKFALFNNLGNGYNKLVNVKFKVLKDTNQDGTFLKIMPTELSSYGYYPTTELMSYKKVRHNDEYSLETCVDSSKTSISIYKKAFLDDILINGSKLSGFDENNYKYSIISNSNKISIASVSDVGYIVSGDIGDYNLKEGINTFIIKVTSPTNDVKNYTLNVSYNLKSDKSKINTLKSLSLSYADIDFKPDINNYNLEVENDVDKLKITSTLSDSKSSYASNYGNREIKLKEGINEVLIKVKAENGDVNTYTIVVNRKEKNKNLKINSLKIKGYDFDFDSNRTNYDLIVEKDVDKLDFIIDIDDKNFDYDVIGNENLKNKSKIVIIISDKDEIAVKKYTINIIKEENDNNNFIKNLIIISSVLAIVAIVICIIVFVKRKKH